MASPIPPPLLFVVKGTRLAEIGRADNGRPVTVPSEFVARFELPGGLVDLAVTAEAGNLRVSTLTATEPDDGGVLGVTLDGIPIARLLNAAGERMARMSGSGAAASAIVGTATRRRVSADRLREVAEAYKSGGIDAVREQQHVGVRQAWRLRQRAAEAGLLDDQTDGGK